MRFVFKHLLILSSLLFIGCQSNDNYNSEVDDIQNGKYIEFIEELSEYSNDPSISSSSSSMNEKNIKHSSRTASLYATETVTNRFSNMFSSKVKSPECRAKVASHFRRYIDAIVNHEALPYVEQQFPYDCPKGHLDYNNLPEGVTFQTLMGTTYQPPPDEAEYIDHPSNLKLLYGILMHENASSTIRLIETLNENNTIFVIHVDGKENSDDAYHELIEYSKKVENVHVVPNEFRIRVNWGGFTMVNATLQILKYSFGLLPQSSSSFSKMPKNPFDFHKFINLSSSTYPIKSNTKIRQTLASYPIDANLMYIAMKPTDSAPSLWYYFVECDDALHTIYRLHLVTPKQNGIAQYMGSQWMTISYEFAEYLVKGEEGTLVRQYMEYAEHYIIADEGFFTTVLMNTRFCAKHHNANFVHLHFDRWESEIKGIERDERKCPLPDKKDHCGRSPTILTKDYMYAFELSQDLFARKFDDDPEVKNALDLIREQEEQVFRDIAEGKYTEKPSTVDSSFEGHGVLIVAKDTVSDHSPLCLSLGREGNYVKLSPCFRDEVLGTLADDWATGAVIEEEILYNSRWEVGPCSTDGSLNRNPETGEMNMTSGFISQEGPHCMIKQKGGLRDGRCIDIANERVEPGGMLQVYPCITKFHQMFSFGDGIVAPKGSVFASVPNHIVKALKYKGKDQYQYLCIGAMGRSKTEYTPWKEDEDKEQYNTVDYIPERAKDAHSQNRIPSLRLWKDKQLVTVPCNDADAVIKFVFVPFIVEDAVPIEPKKKDVLKFHTLDDEL